MSRPQPKRQRSESLNSGQKVSKPRVDKAGDTVKTAMRTLLRGVTEASDAFAPLKSAVGGLSFILNTIDQMGDNRAAAEKLSRRIEKISAYIGRPQIDGEEARRLELSCELDAARRILEPLENQGRVGRFIHSSQNASLIEKYITSVDKAIADYQMCLIEGLHRVSVEQLTRGQRKTIEKLTRAKDAGFDAYSHRSRCLAGTRVEVLHTLYHWATGSDSRQVYWLNGHAGSGKTTIAQSFAMMLSESGDLGASFFCSRDSQQRSDLTMLFPTIAFHLANARNINAPAYRTALLRILEMEPDVASSALHHQLEKLIISPATESGIRTVIVIDALDECRDPDTTSIILDLLSSVIVRIAGVKIIITSRPEPHIRSGFRLPHLQPLTDVLILHEVAKTTVNGDIKLFLRHKLSAIAEIRRREHADLPYDWPSDSHLEILTEKAARLFIFAATIVKFIENRHHDPRDQLQVIVDNLNDSTYEGRSGIDKLYLSILHEIAPDCADTRFLERLRSILGLLVIAHDSLRPVAVAELLEFARHDDVRNTLSSFHSLVMIPDEWDTPIRFHHKSFPDFLTDAGRCTDPRFLIIPDTHHFIVAQRCLRIMQHRLRKNMAGFPRYASNESLDDGLRDQLFGGATGYSCRFWADHVLSDREKDTHLAYLEPLLHRFLTTQQLQWFEVLALLRELRCAVESLTNLRTWFSTHNERYGSLLEWTIDGQKFVLYAFDAISDSVSHIYYSALPFAPDESLLKKHHSEDLSGQARVQTGLVSTWDKSIKTVPMPGIVYSMAHAHNGTMLAAGGEGFVRVLHSSTGQKIHNFSLDPSHLDRVVGVLAFSHDDCIVAATVHDFLYLWDVRTGTRIADIRNDSGDSNFVNLGFHSRRYELLLAADTGGTLALWDIAKCHREGKWNIEDDCLGVSWLSVKGSHHTNILIAYGSRIDICDANTGSLRVIRSCVPPRNLSVHAVASSQDGSFIVFSSALGSIVVYDASTGQSIQMTHMQPGCLNISACWIRVFPTLQTTDLPQIWYIHRNSWPTEAHVLVDILNSHDPVKRGTSILSGHLDAVMSVAYSPDGRFIFTGSKDKTLKIWETSDIDRTTSSRHNALEIPSSVSMMSSHFSDDGSYVYAYPVTPRDVSRAPPWPGSQAIFPPRSPTPRPMTLVLWNTHDGSANCLEMETSSPKEVHVVPLPNSKHALVCRSSDIQVPSDSIEWQVAREYLGGHTEAIVVEITGKPFQGSKARYVTLNLPPSSGWKKEVIPGLTAI